MSFQTFVDHFQGKLLHTHTRQTLQAEARVNSISTLIIACLIPVQAPQLSSVSEEKLSVANDIRVALRNNVSCRWCNKNTE